VSITWKRFIVLSLLLLIVTGILSNLPPFNWDLRNENHTRAGKPQRRHHGRDNGVRIKPKRKGSQAPEITIDEHGVRIKRGGDPASGTPAQEIIVDEHGVRAARTPRRRSRRPPAAPSAKDEAAGVGSRRSHKSWAGHPPRGIDAIGEVWATRARRPRDALADYLPQLSFLFVLLSAAIKIGIRGPRGGRGESRPKDAGSRRESESLQRQVVEMRGWPRCRRRSSRTSSSTRSRASTT